MSHIQEIENDWNESEVSKRISSTEMFAINHGFEEWTKPNVLDFLRDSHLKYLTSKRKELEGEIHWTDLEEISSEHTKGYNLAKQEEIDKLDKEIYES